MPLDIKVEQYCMIVSKFRVYQGLALYYSLKKTANQFSIYILCMDSEALEFMNKMVKENATIISIKLLEDDCLCSLKQNRELDEYCWTLKPVFLEYLLRTYKEIKRITYLDADLFFYSNPDKIFESINGYSVLLSSHDFSTENKSLEMYCGRFNSGLISFCNNIEGLSCLNWWKNHCYNLCSKGFTNNQFGDQKYLDQVPKRFKSSKLINLPGVNVAPWNHSKYTFSCNEDTVFINKAKLICYHFSGFRLVSPMEFSLSFGFKTLPNPVIYLPYLKMIQKAIMDYQEKEPLGGGRFMEENNNMVAAIYKINMFDNSK
ncbi:MAG: hypothetical protein K0Q99_1046 [Clostridia bacterium]|jgi:hypothetical protein|nr:hypothetical protein [Clostridia bacterium]